MAGRTGGRGRSQAQTQTQEPSRGAVTQSQADADAMRRMMQLVDSKRDQLTGLLGPSVDMERWITVALQAIQTTPNLLSCSQLSILSGIRTAAQYGLEIGGGIGIADCSLIPEKGEARLQIEYRGLRKIALRDPSVVKVDADLVYTNDAFRLILGDEPRIEHEPELDGDRGSFRGAYAFAKLRSGEIIPLWLSVAELDKRRDASRSYRSAIANGHTNSPWIQWTAEMYRKTALAALIRSKLRLDPIAREALASAEDVDPSLAGVPISTARLRPMPAIDDPAARIRRRLSPGSVDTTNGNGSAGATGHGDTEAAAEGDTGTDGSQGESGAPEGQDAEPEPTVAEARQLCGQASPWKGDETTCRKLSDHLTAEPQSTRRIHRSERSTWEEGQAPEA